MNIHKNAAKIHTALHKYKALLTNLVDQDNVKIKNVNTALKNLVKLADTLNNLDLSLTGTQDVFNALHSINLFIMATKEIYNIFEYFNLLTNGYSSDKSMSYVANANKEFILLGKTLHTSLSKITTVYNLHLQNNIIPQQNYVTTTQKYDELQSAFLKYPVIDLFIKVTNLVLMHKPRFHAHISANLDILKTKVLHGSDTNVKTIYKNPPLLSYGLTSHHKFRSLNECLSAIFHSKIIIRGETGLKNLAKLQKTSILLLTNNIKYPVAYNAWPLLKYDASKTGGVSQKVISAHTVAEIEKMWKWDFSSKFIEAGDNLVCIEKASTNLYRQLLINDTSAAFKQKLVKYSTKRNVTNATRSYRVNQLESAKIVDNMFLNKPTDLKQIEAEIQQVEYKFLRHEIYLAAIKIFEKRKITKESQFLASIQTDYKKIIIDVTIDEYKKYRKNPMYKLQDTFAFSEILSGFMVQLRAIGKIFDKEMYDSYQKSVKSTKFKYRFDDILNDALLKTINDKTNVYQEMMRKNKIIL
jgi:hypothetical protein